jgi:GT2 family glycosyltransferase
VSRIRIIVISWNTVSMTLECLASLRDAGALQYASVVVVDNASTDGTADLIESQYPEVELVRNSVNVGFAAANNQILVRSDNSKFDYHLLLNSDTLVIGDVIQRSVSYMDEHPGTGVMGCRVLNSDRTVQETCSGFPTLGRLVFQLLALDRIRSASFAQGYRLGNWHRDCERDVDVVSGCYLLVRSEVVRSIGPLDEDFFFFGEETDWCWRIAKAGWGISFAPVGEIVHHGGGSAKKLNYRRDVLLSNALVRLHKKRLGRLSGAYCFAILLCFNLSRALGHSLLAVRRASSRQRAIHFWRVTSKFRYAWHSHASRDLLNLLR